MNNDRKKLYARIDYSKGRTTNGVRVFDLNGKDVTSEVKEKSLENAISDHETKMFVNENTGLWTRELHMKPNHMAEFDTFFNEVKSSANEPKKPKVDIPLDPVMAFLNTCYEKKPTELVMDELKWKYLCRSVLRNKNVMLVGPAGTGKTYTAQSVAKGIERPFYFFNLGASQDPRGMLIGNTHFKKDEGTFFSTSLFVKAIQTENAVILLDELSRAHPEAWNILMTVLDESQRYLRLDEQDGSPTIKVAKGVSFIATANVGSEYTSTRIMDRALMDRFVIIEVQSLDKDGEVNMLTKMFPAADPDMIDKIAEIADLSRKELKTDTPRITTAISSRSTIEMTGLTCDGFSLTQAAEVAIYPFYSSEGGVDSERTLIRQIVQKFI